MAETLREPGWYRLGDRGWERTDDTTAELEVAAGGGWDLVQVHPATYVQTTPAPLF
jgi:hypothetical protein